MSPPAADNLDTRFRMKAHAKPIKFHAAGLAPSVADQRDNAA